jgi:ferredoxin
MVPDTAPEFVRNVTAVMMEGRGDTLPVSAIPVDGTFPTGTTKYEKRNIAEQVPIWEPDLCIQCGQCSIVCPHSVIRAKYYDRTRRDDAPADFKAVPINARGYPDSRYTLQVYVEDCTGCGVCVENCPAHSPLDEKIKAINMKPRLEHMESELASIEFFEKLPWADRTRVNSPTFAACSSSSRCSNFRAHAPGAAKRLTSSYFHSSSATASRSPTRPAARPSTAATCRRPRGRPAPTAAGRRGRTRCSRTTPSSLGLPPRDRQAGRDRQGAGAEAGARNLAKTW